MSTLTNLIVTATLAGSLALGAAMGSGSTMPAPTDMRALIAQTANELQDQLIKSFALERLVHSPVRVEGNHMVVEAKRLPAELSARVFIQAAKSVVHF